MAKILVADDNSNIQKMVCLALNDQGIDVVAVGNGEAAVRKIADVKPDLVLADIFMPVRNGYEVCRYVKENSSLSHIPVILLVGAFDPLDEQEAQRSGADGVLKKPFVPPDPLIFMVKSALTRAGVSIGPAAAPEKPAPAPRSTADILSGNVGSKIASLSPEKLPEIAPEAVEEFAVPPRQSVKIAAGHEPVAFGSMLQTPEEEDVSVLSSKPMIEIAKHKEWEEESKDVPEEDEEDESSRAGWRPGGLDEEVERAAQSAPPVPDWRDEAFHGNSPAKRNGSESWSPSHEVPELIEMAEAKPMAVTTIDAKPTESGLSFSGDAWAAAMAAGIEEKIAQQAEPIVAEQQATPEPAQESPSTELSGTVAAGESGAVPAETAATEPANWAPVPESSWEAEAKRASMLASTWDAPVPTLPTEETQEISAYSSGQPETHAETHVIEDTATVYSGHHESAPEPVTPETIPAIDTSAEVTVEAPALSNWANSWAPPPAIPEPAVEPIQEFIEAPQNASSAAPTAAPEPAAQPDMDELIARVLGKMNPDVLQKVTREILKPVIEAIIRDELDSKNS